MITTRTEAAASPLTEEMRHGDWMITFTGLKFWPLDPRQADVDPRDLAHALSQLNRFGGHLPAPYSVAQHSVYVALQVERAALEAGQGASQARQAALYGLLHDGAEAYLGDLIRPLKIQPELAAYGRAERRIQRCIYAAAGLDADRVPSWVHEADQRMLATEVAQLRPRVLELRGRNYAVPYPFRIRIWSARQAERVWRACYRRYSGRPLAPEPAEGFWSGVGRLLRRPVNLELAAWPPA